MIRLDIILLYFVGSSMNSKVNLGFVIDITVFFQCDQDVLM